MSQEGAGENPPHRRRLSPRKRYPEAAALIDELEELSSLAPAELRRYCGKR